MTTWTKHKTAKRSSSRTNETQHTLCNYLKYYPKHGLQFGIPAIILSLIFMNDKKDWQTGGGGKEWMNRLLLFLVVGKKMLVASDSLRHSFLRYRWFIKDPCAEILIKPNSSQQVLPKNGVDEQESSRRGILSTVPETDGGPRPRKTILAENALPIYLAATRSEGGSSLVGDFVGHDRTIGSKICRDQCRLLHRRRQTAADSFAVVPLSAATLQPFCYTWGSYPANRI